MMEWHSYPTPEDAAGACAVRILGLLDDALSVSERVSIAISGGITPKVLFARLAPARIAWNRIHLFWVDERAVPPDNPLSNYRFANEFLILPAQLPRENVHRIPAELSPDVAARLYTEDIRQFFGLSEGEMPEFDVVHRGMGDDAHTASLFPGEPLIDDREGIAAAIYVEKKAQWRITLLPGALLAAKHTVVLAAGEDKAEALRAVFQEPYKPRQYPSQIGHDRSISWYVDDAAARLLKGT